MSPDFGGSEQQAIINFRVDDLDHLLADLAAAGVRRSQTRRVRLRPFAWIWNPEANRVELWEPSREV
jgi:hypothetical protein